MSEPLRQELADYLALRRALGYRLARPEKLLGQFLDHLDQTGQVRIRHLPRYQRLRDQFAPATGASAFLVSTAGTRLIYCNVHAGFKQLIAAAGLRPRSTNGSVASVEGEIGQAVSMRRRPARVPAPGSGFAGFRFPPDVIMIAVRWYLRYGLSYRDVEELLPERGITVDHVTIYRWVQRFTRHCCIKGSQLILTEGSSVNGPPPAPERGRNRRVGVSTPSTAVLETPLLPQDFLPRSAVIVRCNSAPDPTQQDAGHWLAPSIEAAHGRSRPCG